MKIRDSYDGRQQPFEGDRDLVLRRLPEGARISSARAVVTPELAREDFDFNGESWGATQTAVEGTPGSRGWAEVDFHARRTLAHVEGTTVGDSPPESSLDGASLQVDPGGGVWVDVNERGALGGTELFKLAESKEGVFPLPGLTVRRFKLTAADLESPDPEVTLVQVTSMPANVRLSLGGQPPVWTHPGELVQEVTTPDFAQVLQAFLEEAAVENGFYLVPVTLHSDTIARLAVRFELEVAYRQSVLPEGLDRVALRFDHGGVPVKEENPLRLALPSDARVLSTTGRAVGAFTESRVVLGPTGPVDASASVEVSPSVSQAQRLDLDEAVAADAVDLLVAAVDRAVRLELDLVDDTDGKPGSASLLAAPVALRLERASAGRPTWLSAPLPAELRLAASRDEKTWLVVQSLEGAAQWSARPSAAGEAGLQETRDGRLSWRRAASDGTPASAYFRLRQSPREFRMPLEIEVGQGAAARRVSLRRFDAAERVDLGLDFPELGAAFNGHLDATVSRCPETEHIANGNFERWIDLGDPDDSPFFLTSTPGGLAERALPAEWSLTAGWVGHLEGIAAALLGFGEEATEAGVTALSQVVPVSGGCTYELTFHVRARAEDALAEIFWLDGACGHVGTGTLPVPWSPKLPVVHRQRLDAPAGATQAEVRFTVPEGQILVTGVSLRATAEKLVNGDLAVSGTEGFAGWQSRPDTSDGRLALVQTVPVEGASSFTLDVEAGVPEEGNAGEADTEVVLRWLRADEAPTGEATRLVVEAGGFEAGAAAGAVPADAAAAEVEIRTPARATPVLRRVGLRFPELAEVPLEFVAEAPGELTVTDLEVSWEPVETPAPSPPSTGLCTPTPPGFTPGDLEDGACFCSCCCEKKSMSKTSPQVTEAGRAVLAGECPTCGERLLRFGGAPRPGAELLTSMRLETPRPAAPAPAAEESLAEEEVTLTKIRGIGPKRAAQLANLGITTLADLAKADPRKVERLPMVTLELAASFVREARETSEQGS